jgi:ABC-type transport system involved in multi-copper enzyme maturation permease subunit
MTNILRAEWTKIRSVRSTFWALFVTGAMVIGSSILMAAVQMSDWKSTSAGDRADLLADPTGNILVLSALWGALGACVLGALVSTSEYSSGTIRASLMAIPRRTGMLVGKIVTFGLLLLAIGEISGFAAFFSAQAIMSKHVPMSLSDGRTLVTVIAVGPYLCAFGLLALTIGALLRHTAAALTTSIALVMIVPTLTAGLLGSHNKDVNTFIPGGNAAKYIMSASSDHTDSVLSAWPSFAVSCLWVAIFAALALFLLRRRDA